MPIKKVFVKPVMTDGEADTMQGRLLVEEDCQKLFFEEDVDVYDKQSGKCIAKYRKGVIPGNIQLAAYNNLKTAASPTDARGTATMKDESGLAMKQRVLKSGKLDKVLRAHKLVNSGIIGYFERTVRFPNCRLTAFNANQFEKFKAAYPIIKLVDSLYAKWMPKEYKRQRSMANKTSKDFVIAGTSFTTVTVNKNWQTAVHKDQGDYKEGFGNLVALRDGKFIGGYLVLVKWGVGFDLQNGDLLLMDVHQWHGNTPIIADPKAVRLSLVMYYREKMIHCGTMREELKRVQKRRKGDPLYEKD